MKSELNKIEHYLVHRDRLNEEVSRVIVAWHLDHSLKVINAICDALQVSTLESYRKKFSMIRLISFTFGFLPRGKSRSPKSVLPPEVIETDDIVSQLAIARDKLDGLEELDEKANFRHPFFNELNKKQAQRFIKIHTRHHLKIVRDILKE